MTPKSRSHLVLIPSYNPGPKVFETVHSARQYWNPVWVVVDGSSDGTDIELQALADQDDGLQVIILPDNQGKGAAVLAGAKAAQEAGFTHILTMDSDGQHPAQFIPQFMAVSQANPDAMVLGHPIFDASAPSIRVNGRRISNMWARIETFGASIADSLFGFRIYPIKPLVQVMTGSRWMRRFDFDPEVLVRLSWAGVRAINQPAPVRYFNREEGGVSHFNYVRDNFLLTFMHIRLVLGFLMRLPLRVWHLVRRGRLRSSHH